MYGSLRQGRRAGTTTVAGNTVQFQPTVPFAPGESLSVTIPGSLDSDSTGNTVPRVVQFTAATSGTGRSVVFLPIAPALLPTGMGGMVAGDLDNDLDLLAADQSASTMALVLNGIAGPTTTAAPAWAAAVTLFPNPTHTQATLTLPALPAAHPVVCNALGQVMHEQPVAANTTALALDVHALPPGLYLLRLDAGRAGQLTRRLVVK